MLTNLWKDTFVSVSFSDIHIPEIQAIRSKPVSNETTLELCKLLEEYGNKQGYTLFNIPCHAPAVFIFKRLEKEND